MASSRIFVLVAALTLILIDLSEAQQQGKIAKLGWLGTRPAAGPLAAQNRLPAMYPREDFVESGGLMSYGADRVEAYRRVAATTVGILKSTKPADIPVEQPTKFELVINLTALTAAKQIGLTIPPNVLARADKVIK